MIWSFDTHNRDIIYECADNWSVDPFYYDKDTVIRDDFFEI